MKPTVEEIHESLVNGQRRQMVDQITEYGVYDFWHEYDCYLRENHFTDSFVYFRDAVLSFFHITGR